MQRNKRQIKEAKFWDGFAYKYDAFMNAAVGGYSQLIDLVKSEISKDDVVLETAAGTGLLTIEIAPLCSKIVSCDISPSMVEVASAKMAHNGVTNVEFIVKDICILDFPKESFDVVVAANVMHLLFEPQQALESMLAVLKKDGKLIIPTYCHGENPGSKIISFFMSLTGFKARQKWSIESFHNFLEKNGCKIEKSHVITDKIPLDFVVIKK